MSDPLAVLSAVAGGYLRNPVRARRVTCADCLTPVNPAYKRCFACDGHRGRAGLADPIAFLTYAIAGQESGHLMRGYKAPRPVAEHRQVVGLLLRVALAGHATCAAALAGRPVTHWATVPSLPARPGEHPLRSLVLGYAPGAEVTLQAAARAEQPRAVNAGHFSCGDSLDAAAHVLLIDDTWTSGGHAQSAALALRRAGAARISALIIARWLTDDYQDTRQFLADLRKRDYDPTMCPWTSAGCPAPAGDGRQARATLDETANRNGSR
jgi:hypothetical protein